MSPAVATEGYAWRTPGVRFEWLDAPPRIPRLRTDVAGFVGLAARGPLGRAVEVRSWPQFTAMFGSHTPYASMAYAVEGFFAGGGTSCWIVRAAGPGARPAVLMLTDDGGAPTLALVATSAGAWGNELLVTVERLGADRFGLLLTGRDGARESWRDLTMDPADARFAPRVLGDERSGSRLATAVDCASPTAAPGNTPNARAAGLVAGSARPADGFDDLASLEPAHLIGGLDTLADVDEVAMIAVPDAMRLPFDDPAPAAAAKPDCRDPASQPLPPAPAPAPVVPDRPPEFSAAGQSALQRALVAHAELLQDRIALVDCRPTDLTPPAVSELRAAFETSYAAVHYPWVLVPDPLGPDGAVRAVPPCGHVAGVYARCDRDHGVHQPPANELLEGALAPLVETTEAEHGDLNEIGVNVLRSDAARGGVRLLGARTLSSLTTLRYVNVRRLLMMIEESVDEATQWLVFEPNDPDTWAAVERVVTAFLRGLWRRGMLDGASEAEAYSVRCDAETNPATDVDAGRMSCLIGVLPPWPAEFVVLRIGRDHGDFEVDENVSEARGG